MTETLHAQFASPIQQACRKQKIAEQLSSVTAPQARTMWLLIHLRLAILVVVLSLPLLLVQAAHKSTPQRHRTPSRQPLTARQVARQVLPSVVYIEMEGAGGNPACYGSGFFVAPDEILTNKHVVTCSGTGRGRVRLAGGERSYPTGRILAAPDLDLALIEIQGLKAPPLQLNTTWRLSVGDDIFVAGNPEGLEGTFTRGIVSGVRSEGGLLQIDAPVSPGSSGGPVVDSYGSVVGVTVSSIREGQNLNFAIPTPLIISPLEHMRQMLARMRKGSVRAAGARTPTSTTTPEPVNNAAIRPARRTWEANHDWGDFISERVGDTDVREEFKALLDSGVDVNSRDRGGRTALHLAAKQGQVELARYLLSRGADVNARDALGRTSLMLAIGPSDLKLSGGPYAPLGGFWTAPPCGDEGSGMASRYETSWPAWYSIAERRRPVIRFLLDSGADLTLADKFGLITFDHATRGGLTGFERLLHVPGKSGLPPTCDLALMQAPALQGLRLGMSVAEASAKLGGITPTPRRCGLSTLYATGNRLSAARGFEGVGAVRLVFLDGRVVYLHVAYGREFPFKSFDEYLSTLSSSLGLPLAWRRAAGYPGVESAHAMTCEGFVAAAGRVGVSYVELHDTRAVQTLLWRDVEDGGRLRLDEGRKDGGRRSGLERGVRR